MKKFVGTMECELYQGYSVIRNNSPYDYLLFYLVFLIVLWRIYSKIPWSAGPKPKKYPNTSEDLVKNISQTSKEVKDMLANSRPKVPQVNYNAMSIPRKIDEFIEKLKEIKDMHSYFQADVLDSHINIFQILNNQSDKDYLKLPERELVEPDSALPPLDYEEAEV